MGTLLLKDGAVSTEIMMYHVYFILSLLPNAKTAITAKTRMPRADFSPRPSLSLHAALDPASRSANRSNTLGFA
jgi:hypothetical protein